MACSATVLHAHHGRHLAKAFKTASNGVVTKRDYDNATWFAAEVAPLAGIRDLHALLRRLEDESSACIIRGAPAADTDRLREAAASLGFNRLRPLMAQFIRALPEGHDARSVNTVLLRHIDLGRGQGSGDVVRFAWREDRAEWAEKAPKLILAAVLARLRWLIDAGWEWLSHRERLFLIAKHDDGGPYTTDDVERIRQITQRAEAVAGVRCGEEVGL